MLVASIVVALAGAGCGDGDDARGRADGDGSTAGGSEDARAGAGGDDDVAEGGAPYAVGRRELVLVDPTRGTDAVPDQGVEEQPDRTVEVIVIHPAVGDAGDAPELAAEWSHDGSEDGERVAVVDAVPAEGPFPLVVFAHGWQGRGSAFVPLAEQWARAGHVVALPTFPLSRLGIGFSDDYVNQTDDIAFVIDHLTGEGVGTGLDADDPLVASVDGDRIAIGGHSLGAATVFRGAYNDCCVDDRIDATVTVAGGPLDITEPGYGDQPDTPMLLVHGASDTGVPVAVGDAMVDFVDAPVTYLRFDDGDHTSVFVAEEGEVFSHAVLAFLDAHLRGESDGLDELPAVVEASGLAELRTG